MPTHDTTHIPEWWIETTLGEVCDKIWDGLHGTPNYYNNWEYFFINWNNIDNGKIIIKEDTKRVSQEEYEKYKKDLNQKTILLWINGTVWNLAKYRNEKCILGKSAAYLNIKEDADTNFIYYLMLDNKFQYSISKNANWSTIKNVWLAQLRSYTFSLPPLPEQRAIADILSSLDAKIELLREQNETLERTAQTIFHEWFGRYSVESPEDLSEGWRVGKVSDFMNMLSGFAFKSDDFNENGKYRLVTIANVQDGSFVENTKDGLSELPSKMPDYCNLNTGDILLSLTGNVWRICHVIWENYLLNQRVAKLKAKNDTDYGYTYIYFRRNGMIELLESISAGTAQQNLSPIKTAELEAVIPDRISLDRFWEIINPMIEKILSNLLQIQSLSKTRDELLPKLMSGEVRI